MQLLLHQAKQMDLWSRVAELDVPVEVPDVPNPEPECGKCACLHQAKVDWVGLGRVQLLMAALLTNRTARLEVADWDLIDRERVGLQRQLNALRSID
jgi:hypothetical protein